MMVKEKNGKGETRRKLVDVSKLTPTEEKIYSLFKSGMTRQQIAEELNMAKISVDRRLATINEKVALR